MKPWPAPKKVHLSESEGGSVSLCGVYTGSLRWELSNEVTCKRCRVWPGRAWRGAK